MKRKLLIFVSLFFVWTNATLQWADVAKEAQVLYDLNLMKGTDKGLNLGGQLKRSEAATFIVKVLGKEKHVLKEKKLYENSAFSDVKSEAWYAPFVGYCHQNKLVAGFGDGRFQPEAYVSEKAFLTMLLQAMQYKADQDFNWDSVYSKAYEVGLTRDIKDAVRTKDNVNYTRGDVVHAIYNGLDRPLKGKNQTLAEFLMDAHVSSGYMVKKHGFLRKDKMQTKIESVKVVDSHTIELNFNEPLKTLGKEQLKIQSGKKNLTVESVNIFEKGYRCFVKEALYDKGSYTLTVENIVDEGGFTTAMLSTQFDGIKKQIVVPEGFALVSVTPISENRLDVVFSKPIDEKAEQPLLYKFGRQGGLLTDGNYQNLKAQVVNGQKGQVLLTLSNYKFEAGKSYTLLVRADLSSAYGARLNEGKGDQLVFKGELKNLEPFEVTGVDQVDGHFVRIDFSRSTDEKSALDKKNFKLIDNRRNQSVRPAGVYYFQDEQGIRKDVVMARFSHIRENENYTLEVDDVKDIYKNVHIDKNKTDFEGAPFAANEPKIVGVEAVNRNIIHVLYDRPLSAASERANISVDKNIKISRKKISDKNASILVLYINKNRHLKEGEDYVLMVKSGIVDYLDRRATKRASENFYGSGEYKSPIFIESAKALSDKKIQLIFSEAIRKSERLDETSYEVQYESGSVRRTLFVKKVEPVSERQVILILESAYAQGDMEVHVKKVYDAAGQFLFENLEADVEK